MYEGPVEIDEIHIGGKERNKHQSKKLRAGRRAVGKTAVVGIKDREKNQLVASSVEGVMTQRFQRHPYPAVFDGPDNNIGKAKRITTTTPLQALFAMSSEMVRDATENWAKRLQEQAVDDGVRLSIAYSEIYGRPASPEERQEAHGRLAESGSLASLLCVLMASNEFLFIHRGSGDAHDKTHDATLPGGRVHADAGDSLGIIGERRWRSVGAQDTALRPPSESHHLALPDWRGLACQKLRSEAEAVRRPQ